MKRVETTGCNLNSNPITTATIYLFFVNLITSGRSYYLFGYRFGLVVFAPVNHNG